MVYPIIFPKPVAPSKLEQKKRVSSTGNTAFSSLLDETDAASATATAETIATPAAVSGATTWLGLQEVSEEELARKRSLKQGKSMIDALDKLRDGLLRGTLSHSTIRELERTANEQRATATDPKLIQILDDIELRIAVELAKIECARSRESN
jgi:hypothetical protein